jgi:hypothetical protein
MPQMLNENPGTYRKIKALHGLHGCYSAMYTLLSCTLGYIYIYMSHACNGVLQIQKHK